MNDERMMTSTLRAMLVIALAAGAAAPVAAQSSDAQETPAPARPRVVASEPRTIGGLFGGRPGDAAAANRPQQQLALTFDIGAGHDEMIGVDEQTFAGSDVTQAGAIAVAMMNLEHRWGTSRNYLNSVATGTFRQASVGVRQQEAARAGVQSGVALGRRASFLTSFGAAYEPTYLFTAFGSLPALASGETVSDSSVAEGFAEQRWLSTFGSVGLNRNWTPRQRSDMEFALTRRELLTGGGLDSASRIGQFRYEWSFRERKALQLRYQFEENRQNSIDGTPLTPLQRHHATAGLQLTRRLPRNRSVGFTVGVGATHGRTGVVSGSVSEFTVPSAAAGLQVRMGTGWSMTFDTSRTVSVLEGISVQPFTTDTLTAASQARLGRQVTLNFSGSFAHGFGTQGTQGSFENGVGTAQLRYLLAHCCALTTTYVYYRHQLFDVSTLLGGLPDRYQRHSLRVGMSFWLPLYGSFRLD